MILPRSARDLSPASVVVILDLTGAAASILAPVSSPRFPDSRVLGTRSAAEKEAAEWGCGFSAMERGLSVHSDGGTGGIWYGCPTNHAYACI